MKGRTNLRTVMSVILVLAMLLGMFPAAVFASDRNTVELSFTENTDSDSPDKLAPAGKEGGIAKEEHSAADIVRVSIVLEKDSTLAKGFGIEKVTTDASALSYRKSLESYQAAVQAKIESKTGSKLDVRWNLTLAADIISANVRYGQIALIKEVDGVADVILENRAVLDETSSGPDMATSGTQTGTQTAYDLGYTGAGSRIAIIDTGIDNQHISFSGEAFEYSLQQNAEAKGLSYDEYVESLDLLDEEEILAVADQLNAPVDGNAYLSSKLPYSYNYVDKSYYISHEKDTQSEHGSHVSGIAAANRYVKNEDGGFDPALEAVKVQGVSPDAQIITMKVFGIAGGAYDSDYFAAVEDAIVLGCDACNLSLGSAEAGISFDETYADVLDLITESGMVVTMSMGNSSYFYSSPYNPDNYGYQYYTDTNWMTGGSPATFNNSLAVASVDNLGSTGYFLMFGDLVVFYNESLYKNESITTLAPLGEIGYVMIDGIGTDEDFAALGDALEGKIAMCSRGETSFYQKAMAAVDHGAIATIIYNNTDGMINMLLSDYEYTQPAVLISQEDGAKIKAQSEVNETAEGAVYYTGTLSLSDEVTVIDGEYTPFQTMSDFSSWGTTGILSLKPEITAPGGNIYSVNGLHDTDEDGLQGGHDQYENMNGTSMASPQVAGIAGLMSEYLKDSGLCEATGLTARQLTNSLLMSTAEPIYEDYGEYGYGYYSVLQQGAGVVNVANAMSAMSYILMDEDAVILSSSAKDGKVKAELGDDPERTGEYTYSFTLYPLTETKTFTLSTDIFTQDLTNDGVYLYTDTWTIDLPAAISYSVNGEEINNDPQYYADVNGDGITDENDAQAILDYITGKLTEEDIIVDYADVDYDGVITTTDARLILQGLNDVEVTIESPSVITVSIALTDDIKDYLNDYYPGGAYIEGYTGIVPSYDEDGYPTDVVHTIPILALYGSDTDAPMFDHYSYIDENYGPFDPYVASYFMDSTANNLYITYPGDDTSYTFTGNPYLVEEEYHPERFAIQSGTDMTTFRYILIRAAGTVGTFVANSDGEIVYTGEIYGNRLPPYYYETDSTWQNLSPKKAVIDATPSGLGFSEGDAFIVGIAAFSEYQAVLFDNAGGATPVDGNLSKEEFTELLANGYVGDGAYNAYMLTVDDTAPELSGVTMDLLSGDITVSAKDNQYIAAVELTNTSRSKSYGLGIPEQEEAGQECTYTFGMEGQTVTGDLIVTVCDYAGNETEYTIEMNTGKADFSGKILAFTNGYMGDGEDERIMEVDPATVAFDLSDESYAGYTYFSATDKQVLAAEYAQGYLFCAMDDEVIYALDISDTYSYEYVRNYYTDEEVIYDMAFNYADNTMYLLYEGNKICSMDVNTGEISEVLTLTVTNPVLDPADEDNAEYFELKDLAIDDEGNFYSMNTGDDTNVYLYRFSPEDAVSGTITDLAPVNNTEEGYAGIYNMADGGAMSYDHGNDILYVVSNAYDPDYHTYYAPDGDVDNILFTVDTATGKASRANAAGIESESGYDTSACVFNTTRALIVIPPEMPLIAPTDAPLEIYTDLDKIELLTGQTYELFATVLPWTLTDKSAAFTSSDEEIITVDENGIITAVAAGSATLTITSNAQPAVSKELSVTVADVPVTEFKAVLSDYSDYGSLYSFSTDKLNEYELVADILPYNAGTIVGDAVIARLDNTLEGYDADTYQEAVYGDLENDLVFSALAEIPDDIVSPYGLGNLLAISNHGSYLAFLDTATATGPYFDLGDWFLEDPMALICYAGREDYTYEEDGSLHENCAKYYVITEGGYLSIFYIDHDTNLYSEDLGETGITLTGISGNDDTAFGSMIFDAGTGFLYLTYSSEETTGTDVYAIDAESPMTNVRIGNIPEAKFISTMYQYEPKTDLYLSVAQTDVTLFEGTSQQLDIKIKLGETNGFTAVSSDTDVVTVDGNGLMTGVGLGNAVVTITTVDTNAAGEHLSADVNVTVAQTIKIDTNVAAQISSGGTNIFCALNLSSLDLKYIADSPAELQVGGLGGDLYFADTGEGVMFLDGNDFTDKTDTYTYLDTATYAVYPANDVANIPVFEYSDGTVEDHQFFMTTSIGYIVTPDYYGYNLSTIPDMAGVCFAGLYEEEGVQYLTYFILGTSGNLYSVYIDTAEGFIYPSLIAETGITLADPQDASIAYLNETNDKFETVCDGIIIAVKSTMMLWYVDLSGDTPELSLIGQLPYDSIDGLIGTFDTLNKIPTGGYGNIPVPSIISSPSKGAAVLSCAKIERTCLADEIASTASYTLNSADTDKTSDRLTGRAGLRSVSAEAVPDDKAIDIVLTEDTDVTNGFISVAYDTDIFTFDSVSCDVMYSVNDSEGVVYIAYASLEPIAAGDTIATVRLTREAGCVNREASIVTYERNGDIMLDQTEEPVTVQLTGNDGDHRWVETARTDATCEEAGSVTYTCEDCGLVKTVVLEALGHDYETVTVEATCDEDGYITYTCKNDPTHTYTEVIKATGHSFVEVEATEPTCEEPGYTAGLVCEKCGYAKSGHEYIAPLGHTVVIDPEIPATTVSEGKTAGAHCSVCGKILVEQLPIPVLDVTELSNALLTAFQIIPSVYTDDMFVDLSVALAEGFKVMNSGRSQEEIDSAVEAIKDALGSLVVYSCTEDEEGCPGAGFTDMPAVGYWSHAAIDWAVRGSITSGTSKTTFSPTANCTRGQAITFLWKLAGSPETYSDTNPFNDVKSSDYYYQAILWAVENEITKGTSDTTFSPNATCTRGQTVTFLYRFAGSPESSSEMKFTDIPEGMYCEDAVLWAVEHGVTSGTSDTTFSPNNYCTREQFVTFLYRFVLDHNTSVIDSIK